MLPTPCVALGSAGLRVSLSRAVRGSSFSSVRDRAGSNVPVSIANPEGGLVALFSARPETRRPHDRARLTAKGAARERLYPTVKQVSIPVHGANPNRAPEAPCPAPRRQAPVGRPLAGLRSWVLRATKRAGRSSRQDAVRSPSRLIVGDGAGGNTPAPDANLEGGRMALFMVQPETRWPHDRADLMAPAVLERDSRTVKQVNIPVHGATRNDASGHPFLHRAPRRLVTGVQPVPGLGAMRAATRGQCEQPSRRDARPHLRSHAASRHWLRHSQPLGSDATRCTCNHAPLHRL